MSIDNNSTIIIDDDTADVDDVDVSYGSLIRNIKRINRISPIDYRLYHYSFDATAKLYDLRRKINTLHNEPIDRSKKYHYEIFEITHDDKPRYDVDEVTGKSKHEYIDIENYTEYGESPTELGSFTTEQLKPFVDTYQCKLPVIHCWFPRELIRETLFNEYDKILGNPREAERIQNQFAWSLAQIDDRYCDAIKKTNPEIYEQFELDKVNIAEWLETEGLIDLVSYMSHDLTYLHPIFYNNQRLKDYFKNTIISGVWYMDDDNDCIAFIKRTEVSN